MITVVPRYSISLNIVTIKIHYLSDPFLKLSFGKEREV